MSDANTTVATIDETAVLEVSNEESISQAIAALQSGHNTGLVHSFVGTDEETVDEVLAALSDTTPVADVIGQIIPMRNYIVQKVRIRNDDGSETVAPRIVIIADDDKAYHVTSPIVLRDLMTFIGMRGEPATWEKPLNLKFEKGGTGNGRFITANVVRAPKASKQ